MKLSVMQPYLFPYIGYFQLIQATDKFIVYDDVSFIKQGWINRNRILANGKAHLFTVPLSGASSFKPIHDTRINVSEFSSWRNKFVKSLDQSYLHAPQYKYVKPLVLDVLDGSPEFIVDIAVKSVKSVCSFLEIPTAIENSSRIYGNNDLRSQARIIDICHKEAASGYVNAIGGMGLYSFDDFADRGVELAFIKPREVVYDQQVQPFVPWLSIIDVLMFNSAGDIRQFLNSYELVKREI